MQSSPPPSNEWHYVTISKKVGSQNIFTWRNKAGVEWDLIYLEEESSSGVLKFKVGENCPFNKDKDKDKDKDTKKTKPQEKAKTMTKTVSRWGRTVPTTSLATLKPDSSLKMEYRLKDQIVGCTQKQKPTLQVLTIFNE